MDALRARAKHMATHCLIFQSVIDEWIQQYPELFWDFVEWGPTNTWSKQALNNACRALATVDDASIILEAAQRSDISLCDKAAMFVELIREERTETIVHLLANLDALFAKWLAVATVNIGSDSNIDILMPHVLNAFSPTVFEAYQHASPQWAAALNALVPLTPHALLEARDNVAVYALATAERTDLWEALRSERLHYTAHALQLPDDVRDKVTEEMSRIVGRPFTASGLRRFHEAICPEHYAELDRLFE